MKLSAARIADLSSRPGVDRAAVANFLGTLDDLTQSEALANLELDAVAYGWSTATGRAIQQGIMEATSHAPATVEAKMHLLVAMDDTSSLRTVVEYSADEPLCIHCQRSHAEHRGLTAKCPSDVLITSTYTPAMAGPARGAAS